MRTLKILIKKIKDLWNVYGGVLFSGVVAWVSRWDKNEMDRWASYLILTLTCISLLTFFKIMHSKNKRKKLNVIDKGTISSQKPLKTLKTAVDPLSVGKDLGNAIIFTVKGGRKVLKKIKDFFKKIWGNKFTLGNTIIVLFLATLSQVMTYTEYLYRITWFAEHELIVKIISPIIAVIWVFIDLFTTYTKYGFESLQEIADRKAQKKLESLPKNEREKIKQQIKTLKETLEIAVNRYNQLKANVLDTENLIGVGYAITTREKETYEYNKNQLSNIEVTIENLKAKIDEEKAKL